jgi:hypothetical protein
MKCVHFDYPEDGGGMFETPPTNCQTTWCNVPTMLWKLQIMLDVKYFSF